MVVLEHILIDNSKLESLKNSFPKLIEENQHYVLGIAEGLMQAQDYFNTKFSVTIPDNANLYKEFENA